MRWPKGWEREAWAKCADCGYLLRTQEIHRCNGMVYQIGFSIRAIPEDIYDRMERDAARKRP